MRRTSQSMYQPSGVVGNKSMAVSKLMGSSGMEGVAGKSMLAGKLGQTRKVEGHDLAKTGKSFV